MGTEIERKFRIRSNAWRAEVTHSHHIQQGYLATGPPTAIRVRIVDNQAILNIKKATVAIQRSEFEYPIPLEDGQTILDTLCTGHLIVKTRHYVPMGTHTWEIDEFEGVNAGLIVTEIELQHPDEAIPSPPWLGDEVSHDPRYLNTCLTITPYSAWR